MGPARLGRLSAGDVVAGVTVALVLIPQSVAYAVLAGMRPAQGLVVGAVATIAAAPFVSSPWLQTGPVAITSLLTFGALAGFAEPGTSGYVALGALLAVLVGVVRLAIGLARAGVLAHLMSQPVLVGFTPGAALVIAATQVPAALGVERGDGGIVGAAVAAAVDVASWDPAAVGMTVVTVVVVAVARRLHPLVPGVLLAVVAGILYAHVASYDGAVVGAVPDVLPMPSLSLPWASLPSLLVPAAVIALVGFAEAAAIARTFAAETRTVWDADREFVSQGVANVTAGLFSGFPVGGSFSRSAINRAAGARTARSGAVTGVVAFAFLPFAGLLERLPMAVLAAIIIVAVARLVDIRPVLQLRRFARVQFGIAAGTFVLTLVMAPSIQWAVVIGIAAAVFVHLRRELMIDASVWVEETTLHLRPHGVLFFASAAVLETQLVTLLSEHPDADHLVVHFDSLGRVDVTGAMTIRTLCERAASAGLETTLTDFTPPNRKIVARVLAGCPRSRITDVVDPAPEADAEPPGEGTSV